MRDLISFSGAVFVVIGAIVLVLGALLVIAALGTGGTGLGFGLLIPVVVSGAAVVLVGGLTWTATQQDRRLEQIELLLRRQLAQGTPGTPAPNAPAPTLPDWMAPRQTVRTVIIGSEAPGERPTTPLPPLPRVGAEAEPGWYHRAAGPAEVWHPGGPVSGEAHDR